MLGIYKVNSLIVSRAVHFTHDSKNLYFFSWKLPLCHSWLLHSFDWNWKTHFNLLEVVLLYLITRFADFIYFVKIWQFRDWILISNCTKFLNLITTISLLHFDVKISVYCHFLLYNLANFISDWNNWILTCILPVNLHSFFPLVYKFSNFMCIFWFYSI